MSVIDRILSLLAPYECLGCSAEGDLLCAACIGGLEVAPECCYRCQTPSQRALTCLECREDSHLWRVQAATGYAGLAKELVWKLKTAGARAAAPLMAARLLPLLNTVADSSIEYTDMTIVPVPTAASRVRGRGYDQAELLARELSRRTRLPYLDCLVRSGHTRQVGKSRNERLEQLDGAFRVRGAERICGRRILLIDDVITTGATLEAAAETLGRQGAGPITAMAFARA